MCDNQHYCEQKILNIPSVLTELLRYYLCLRQGGLLFLTVLSHSETKIHLQASLQSCKDLNPKHVKRAVFYVFS